MTGNKRFTWNGTSDGVGSIMDNETEGYLSYSQCIPVLNALHEEKHRLELEVVKLSAINNQLSSEDKKLQKINKLQRENQKLHLFFLLSDENAKKNFKSNATELLKELEGLDDG